MLTSMMKGESYNRRCFFYSFGFHLGITPGGARGPCETPGIKPRSAACKATTQPTVLSFWPRT